ncbi:MULTISPECIES: DUF1912 family protein [unclassified Streptococcus]|uniref:DUF1912 family protein n=1 Tax=unclassified Streptococcus TaxID=2608887 RepID=UPI0011B4DE1B|nr:MULTISPECIES: DUF1912 family protein [unclassified Streptococcus]TWT11972.1 DUF1912 family protein [Streptococcus sp. sy004]TWT16352.1 DUF1912 family protein [Streptococcus sp. sy010]
MTVEQEFLKDLDEWLTMQVMVNQVAMEESQKEFEAKADERAKDAIIRYESRLDAYQFLQGKLDNYKNGKAFHDLPDGLFGTRNY